MLTIFEGKFTRLKEDRDNIIKAKEALELAEPGEQCGCPSSLQPILMVIWAKHKAVVVVVSCVGCVMTETSLFAMCTCMCTAWILDVCVYMTFHGTHRGLNNKM